MTDRETGDLPAVIAGVLVAAATRRFATDEARMLLPGAQAVMGFQLMAVFNQRFEALRAGEQIPHLSARSSCW